MLVCASLTTLVVNGSGFYSEHEEISYWEITSVEYFASIIFIDPSLVGPAFGQADARWVEGVYWTLWREVLFYVTVALLFWTVQTRFFTLAWAILQGFSTILLVFAGGLENAGLAGIVIQQILQPTTLAFFTFGMFLWRAHNNQLDTAMWAAAGFAIISIISRTGIQLFWGIEVDGQFSVLTIMYRAGMYVSMGVLISLAIFKPIWVNALSYSWFRLVGLISYPLYLCHERVGIILLNKFYAAGLPSLVALAVVLCIVFMLALAVHRFVEMPGKNSILNFISK